MERTIEVTSCARCGKDHDVTFYQFGNPIVDTDGTIWDWWGLCPNTGDPVLLRSDRADIEPNDSLKVIE